MKHLKEGLIKQKGAIKPIKLIEIDPDDWKYEDLFTEGNIVVTQRSIYIASGKHQFKWIKWRDPDPILVACMEPAGFETMPCKNWSKTFPNGTRQKDDILGIFTSDINLSEYTNFDQLFPIYKSICKQLYIKYPKIIKRLSDIKDYI